MKPTVLPSLEGRGRGWVGPFRNTSVLARGYPPLTPPFQGGEFK